MKAGLVLTSLLLATYCGLRAEITTCSYTDTLNREGGFYSRTDCDATVVYLKDDYIFYWRGGRSSHANLMGGTYKREGDVLIIDSDPNVVSRIYNYNHAAIEESRAYIVYDFTRVTVKIIDEDHISICYGDNRIPLSAKTFDKYFEGQKGRPTEADITRFTRVQSDSIFFEYDYGAVFSLVRDKNEIIVQINDVLVLYKGLQYPSPLNKLVRKGDLVGLRSKDFKVIAYKLFQ